MTNATDRTRYHQARALLGEMRRIDADEYDTWALPGGALSFAMYRDDDQTPIERGYLSADGDIRTYVMEAIA